MSTEIDYMEYANDAAAQSAYVTNAESCLSMITDNASITLGDKGSEVWKPICQSFKLYGNQTIESIDLKCTDKNNTPTGNWSVRIETDNSGQPSGTLANANATKTQTPSTSGVFNVAFSTPFSLSSLTTYWIVINCDAQADQNYWYFSYNTASSYSNGLLGYYADGSFRSYPTAFDDLYFKIYVQEAEVYALKSYSESTIKTQGSYSLKCVASITGSLNKTLTRTFS